MSDYDKIKILWIDDRESGSSALPESTLPEPFAQWFKITHHQGQDSSFSYQSIDDFLPVFKRFWEDEERGVLPAEIVTMDYNLSKYSGLTVINQPVQSLLDILKNSSILADRTNHSNNIKNETSTKSGSINFEGLLIGLFYGTMVRQHPMGLVPMTLYQQDMPSEVYTLHALTQPFLGVSYENFGLAVEDRVWSKLIPQGVKKLRERICQLFAAQEILVLPSDILALAESSKHERLTIFSPFACRCLPVQGLFIDTPEDQRDAAIQRWANELLLETGKRDDILNGIRAARKLLEFSEKESNKNLIHERDELSSLLATGNGLERLATLKNKFGFKANNGRQSLTNHCFSLDKFDSLSDVALRYAILYVIANIVVDFNLYDETLLEDDLTLENGMPSERSIVESICPIPSSPVILPWHEKGKSVSDSIKFIERRGKLHISQILSGSEGKNGFDVGEKYLFMSFIMDVMFSVCGDAKQRLRIVECVVLQRILGSELHSKLTVLAKDNTCPLDTSKLD